MTELDARGDAERSCVRLSDRERIRRRVGRDDAGVRRANCDRACDRTGTSPNIDYDRLPESPDEAEGLFHEGFRFRTRDEHARIDHQGDSEEFLESAQVRDRLTRVAALHERYETGVVGGGEPALGVREDLLLRPAEREGQQDVGVERRGRGISARHEARDAPAPRLTPGAHRREA